MRVVIFVLTFLYAGSLSPPIKLQVSDHPWDHGDKIDLMWNINEDILPFVKEIHIYSSISGKNDFQLTTIVPAHNSSITIDNLLAIIANILRIIVKPYSPHISANLSGCL